ncbi:MAG: Gfo/Idh/MocA family oxidoreductase [Gammaproteobacteria bacterium]|nr:Gfo/Idh/MocA family oxidoreductase [Gammaproteobacteria bacterium]MDH5302883.1 Gfo/Idh/MocA family oxidoreductase [Gammaproteobacteria bacterium]MDH5320988.1 Gfo/Idh/MocA family oxidoreductase [Gammaproteobacteria bacterium]
MTVNWGILGTANIALTRTIPFMAQVACARAHAIASRSLEKSKRAAADLNIPKAYGSYEALLDDAEIDAVYIPLPNNLHREWSIRAMEAGKHVLCEKPMSLLPEDVRAVIEVRDRTGKHIEEGFGYKNHPQWDKIDELLAADAIGTPLAAHGVLAMRFMNPDDIRNSPELGGGATYDLGSYAISAATMIFKRPPRRVLGVMEHDPDLKIDRLSTAILDYGDAHATFTVSTQGGASAWATHQQFSVLGSHGWLRCDFPYAQARPTACHLFVGDLESYGGFETQKFEFPAVSQYGLEIERFSRHLLGEKVRTWELEDALLTLTIIRELFASARGDCWRDIRI